MSDDKNEEIDKSLKFRHHCWDCGYHTNNKADLDRHNDTIKHMNNTNKDTDKSSFQYHCWPCNFHANFQSKLLHHENTIKHKQNVYKNPNIVILSDKILIFINVCEICEMEFTHEKRKQFMLAMYIK